jgi:hypothetical protein
MRLSNEQKKQLLSRQIFWLNTNGRALQGRLIGFDTKGHTFGGVVRYPNGMRAFWGVDDRTLQAVDLGMPPHPRRRF